MAATTALLRKPVFTKVDQLRPGTSGHTLTVKVVSAKLVLQKARPDGNQVRHVRIAECIVGDDTGVIVFTARNEQGESEFFTPLKPRFLFFFVFFFFVRSCGLVAPLLFISRRKPHSLLQ
jgi:hypothetical protein